MAIPYRNNTLDVIRMILQDRDTRAFFPNDDAKQRNHVRAKGQIHSSDGQAASYVNRGTQKTREVEEDGKFRHDVHAREI
ncbi:hypothetical protein T265_14863, partial [Opisthorchis viverrini]